MATNNNTITRRKYDRDFTIVSNEFLKDARLSWKAKGIIAYVAMLPDDWVLNMRDLTNRATDGRDSLYSGIKELETCGYCAKTMRRNPDGTIAGYAYEICDKPVFVQPFTENPVTDAPQPEKPDTVKPDTDKPGTDKPGTENPTLINTNPTKDENKPSNKGSNPANDVVGGLFPDNEIEVTDKKKTTMFRNSGVYKLVKDGDYTEFEKLFATPEFAPVDLVYYFHSVADWSDTKIGVKRTFNGWVATVRNFIRGDVEKKKVHLKPEHQAPQNKLNVGGAMEFLNDYD